MPDGSSIPFDPACAAGAEDMRAAHARMLRRMAEIVLEVAEAVRDRVIEGAAAASQAEPAAPRAAPAEVGLTLSRLSRALERRFADEAASFAAKEQAKADEAASAAARSACYRQAALEGAREGKRDAIAIAKAMLLEQMDERGLEGLDREALFSDLDERLDDDSDLEALSEYGLIELVSFLCAGLGVAFEPADWNGDEAALRREWLDGEPDPPPKPPNHPAWALIAAQPP